MIQIQYVYEDNDVVSWFILNRGGWELGEITEILYGLDNYKERKGIANSADIMFLDIGDQIG